MKIWMKFQNMKKITEAINTFSKRNFSILASSKMVKILKLSTNFWVLDWKTKYSEVRNMTNDFFNKPQNKFNKEIQKFKKEDEYFSKNEKLSLMWMFKNGTKYGISRKSPIIAMSSTYLAKFLVPSETTCGLPIVIQKLFLYKQIFGNQAQLSKKINGINFFINEIQVEEDYIWIFWKNNLSQTKFRPYNIDFEYRAQKMFFDIQKLSKDDSKFFDFNWRLKQMKQINTEIKDIQLEKSNGILDSFKPPKSEEKPNATKKNYSNIKNENMEFLSKTTYIVEEEKNGEKEDKTPENKNKKENENEKKRKNSKKKKKEIRYESSNLKIKLFKKKLLDYLKNLMKNKSKILENKNENENEDELIIFLNLDERNQEKYISNFENLTKKSRNYWILSEMAFYLQFS